MTRSIIRALAAAALIASPCAIAQAGPFDCAVVYDEFDSLMNKNFLLKPEAYTRVQKGKISRDGYNTKQKGRLLLSPHRKGMGVAIVHTNKNSWGKFLFTWAGPGDLRGTPLLILRDITVYGRVQDGYAPRRTREIRLSSSQSADLDSGRIGETKASDVWFHNPDGKTLYVEAVNGASLSFPMETLCKQ